MLKPDKETLHDIQRWYHNHQMPFLEEDWQLRSDTGESDSPQSQEGERTKEVRSSANTADRLWWWEKQQFPWRKRTHEEQEWQEKLDQFFAPYLAMLPRPKGNLLRSLYGDLRSFTELGLDARTSRQAAFKAARSARRALIRLIAEDDPQFVAPVDGRTRDYEGEEYAAERVFFHYLEEVREDE